MLKFNELDLKEEIIKAIDEMGFEHASPIQEQAIPIALTGQDVIGQAQTGTGKTAAFSIPFLQMLEPSGAIQVLILTPTRELCTQVAKEISKIGRYLRVRPLAIYGGQDISRQIRALKDKPQIIVATPGRLMDHMERKTIKLDNLKMVVLDEADEMLNMGFLEDIEKILSSCPEERQTMMFSATMKDEIKRIANTFMKEPELVKVKAQELTVPSIEQKYYEVPEDEKFRILCRLLDIHNPELAMIFGRTKRRVDEVTEALQRLGYKAEGLHGDLTQRHRETVMNKFRNGQINILVATDVAARGLDVSGVTHVFNFDLPQDIDSYVHRIGRTGRAGKEGIALTFVEPREQGHLRTIEATIKRKLKKSKLPSAVDTKIEKQNVLFQKIADAVESEKGAAQLDIAARLVDELGPVEALAATLEMLVGDNNRDREINKIRLTAERPLRIKKSYNDRNRGGYGSRDRKPYGGGGRGNGSGRSNGGERNDRYNKGEKGGKPYNKDNKEGNRYNKDGNRSSKPKERAAFNGERKQANGEKKQTKKRAPKQESTKE